jgi:hypothetical protein
VNNFSEVGNDTRPKLDTTTGLDDDRSEYRRKSTYDIDDNALIACARLSESSISFKMIGRASLSEFSSPVQVVFPIALILFNADDFTWSSEDFDRTLRIRLRTLLTVGVTSCLDLSVIRNNLSANRS